MIGAVAREIKKKYGTIDITVNGAHEELLRHNPNIHKTGLRHDGIDLNYHYGRHSAGAHLEKNLIDVMCKRVGIHKPSHTVDIYLTREELDYAEHHLAKLHSPVVVAHASSGPFGAGRKLWPGEHWQALAVMLRNAGCTVVQLGDDRDYRIRGAHDFVGKQDIRRSIAIIAKADVLVGIVSSLMHAASAVNTPAIIIYGGFERYQAHGYGNVTPIESPIDCSPCVQAHANMEPCPIHNRCMREIEPERIHRAVMDTLGHSQTWTAGQQPGHGRTT